MDDYKQDLQRLLKNVDSNNIMIKLTNLVW